MKLKVMAILTMFPAVAFADRFGSLRSNSDILLSTQAVAGINGNLQYNNSGAPGGASFFNIHVSSSSTTADTVWTSNSIGPVLTDSNHCTWRTGVNTSGVLTTALINCP